MVSATDKAQAVRLTAGNWIALAALFLPAVGSAIHTGYVVRLTQHETVQNRRDIDAILGRLHKMTEQWERQARLDERVGSIERRLSRVEDRIDAPR